MSFYASTRDGHQSRSRRFGSTPFFENRNVKSAGGSVVKSIEAESPLSSITTSICCKLPQVCFQVLIASCVSSSSLLVRSMSAESTSASDNQSNVSCSSICSLGSYFKRRRMEMTRKRGNTFEGMQENLEFENFEKIFNGLHGKLDAQALVIKGIADKKFEPKLSKKDFSNDDEPMAAPSTNKWDMLSDADWAIILERVTRNRWSVDMLHKAEKKWLCKVGCFCGGIDPASALVSRRLHANADFIVSRCNSVLGDRWPGIKYEVSLNPSVKKATYLHDFEKDGRGVVIPEYDNEEKTSGYLVWNGLPLNTKVRIPDGFCVAGVGVSTRIAMILAPSRG